MKESDENGIKILMEQMAAEAAKKTLLTENPLLPPGWVLLTTFAGKPFKPTVPVQGLLAVGPINDDLDFAVVIALGITWENFYGNNTLGAPLPPTDKIRLPNAITGTATPLDANVTAVFGTAYNGSRSTIWDSLSFVPSKYATLPVYVTGIGLGSPIAQICALDLRKGNVGPAQQNAPATMGPCYVFSAPNFANNKLADYISSLISQKQLEEQYVIWAATQSLTADFFPTSPSDDRYTRTGKLVYMESIKLPQYDVPWWERSDIYYLQSLGGQPIQKQVVKLQFSNVPAGFSQDLAFTASQTVAATYQLGQHINGSTKIDNSAFTLNQTIAVNGSVFASIYTSFNTVLVAFRGPVTFQEYYALSCLSSTTPVSFLKDTSAQVHSGAYALYSSPADGGGVFSKKLIDILKPLTSGKTLVLAGHDLGGAVAGIAATDFALNDYGFKAGSLYTFGSTLFANVFFVDLFNTAMDKISYQVTRLNDKMALPIRPYGFFPVNNAITMTGQLEIEEYTFHSITNYCNLLNPSAKAGGELKN